MAESNDWNARACAQELRSLPKLRKKKESSLSDFEDEIDAGIPVQTPVYDFEEFKRGL